jgi:quercetin dioxygenase-like cupin family protein
MVNLQHLADDLLAEAARDTSRRAARTLPHPVDGLRQTIIALAADARLQEHNSPGPASLLVLRGSARLTAGEDTVPLVAGDLVPIPPERHSLSAEGSAVVLLSVAIGPR